jgi:hypothetical protein
MPEFEVRDKTKMFVALQEELLAGGIGKSRDPEQELADEEAVIAPYFETPVHLPAVLRIGSLRYEYAFLQQHRGAPWIEEAVRELLGEFREARNANAAGCFSTWVSWMASYEKALRNITSVAHLEADKEKLAPDLFAKSCIRDIGDMLEGSLQPFVRLRLDMKRVAGKRATTAAPVPSMSFGQVIGELVAAGRPGAIYRPLSYGLTVSQWRNIANHNSYEVCGQEVVCAYGTPGSLSTLRMPLNELLDLARYVNSLYYVHKVAYEFFAIDNLDQIKNIAGPNRLTEHTLDCCLAEGLVRHGFRILAAGQLDDVFALGLTDTLERAERASRSALQAAVTAYVILGGAPEINALVQSGRQAVKFSFRVAIPAGDAEIPADFQGDIGHFNLSGKPKPATPADAS